MTSEELSALAANDALIEVARRAIEDRLVDWRESRLSSLGRGNGLVIRETNGQESSIIRFGPETAMRIGLEAIANHLAKR